MGWDAFAVASLLSKRLYGQKGEIFTLALFSKAYDTSRNVYVLCH